MQKTKFFLLPSILLFSVATIASSSLDTNLPESNKTATYNRPDFKHIYIPSSIEIVRKGEINAPVGDYRLQSPIVKVKINGKGPYNFMFDSGFSQSMISAGLAKKLDLPVTESKDVRAITSNQVVNIFQTTHFVKKMQVGDVYLSDYNLVVSSSFEDEVELFKNMRIDGVLSANAFYPQLLTIDYQREKLIVRKGRLNKGDEGVNPSSVKSSTPTLRTKLHFAKLNKTIYQNLTVDTGCYSHIFVNACDIPEMTKFKGKEDLIAYDYQGNKDTEYFAQLFGKIELLPNYAIKSPYITFARSNCQLKKREGLLCRKFFEDHKVTVDLVNSLIKLKRY